MFGSQSKYRSIENQGSPKLAQNLRAIFVAFMLVNVERIREVSHPVLLNEHTLPDVGHRPCSLQVILVFGGVA